MKTPRRVDHPAFAQISTSEVRLNYMGKTFLLAERPRGAYGFGSAVQLYLVDGFEKKRIAEVGWTKSDEHGCDGMKQSLITEISSMDRCKEAAVKYIDSLA